ncbi:MAG: ABC transporter permease [Dysgonomonas sp.]
MKQFIAFVRKEFIHLLRDPRSIGILLFIPIVLVALFGFAITNEVKNVKVGVYDQSKDESTQRIIEKFNASSSFNIVAVLTSIDEVDTYFETDRVDMVLVFDKGFAQNLLHTGKGSIQIIADASNPNVSILATNYATMVIESYQLELAQELNIPIVIVPITKMLYNPLQKDAYNFVPGIIGMILTLICALMTAVSIVREKELGTMEVLLVSPVKPIYIIVSKLIPYFVLSLIDLALILFMSVYVLKVPIVGNFITLMFICILFILVSLSIGMLISTFAKTQMDAMIIAAVVLLVPMLLLSGMIFPISNMPEPLQWLSTILPMTWFVAAIKKVMIEGLGIMSIIKESFIMFVMIVFCLFISLKNFKIRLE